MTNLIGRDVERWREALDDPQAKLHLCGKSRVRPGRKMGHITRLLPRS
jgi:5-(carboxyamino)imidazole ribonucleotide synthase